MQMSQYKGERSSSWVTLTTANGAKDNVIETLTRDLADPKSAQVKTEVYDAKENLNI